MSEPLEKLNSIIDAFTALKIEVTQMPEFKEDTILYCEFSAILYKLYLIKGDLLNKKLEKILRA